MTTIKLKVFLFDEIKDLGIKENEKIKDYKNQRRLQEY